MRPFYIILAEIVVLVQHTDFGVQLVLEDVGGIVAAVALIIRLPADRPWEVFGVVPFGGASGNDQLRHLVLVHVVPDCRIGRRPERAGDQQHTILLDQPPHLLDGFWWAIGVIIWDEDDLAPVHPALVHLEIGGLGLADGPIGRGRPTVAGIADLDPGIGDAGTVFFRGACRAPPLS